MKITATYFTIIFQSPSSIYICLDGLVFGLACMCACRLGVDRFSWLLGYTWFLPERVYHILGISFFSHLHNLHLFHIVHILGIQSSIVALYP